MDYHERSEVFVIKNYFLYDPRHLSYDLKTITLNIDRHVFQKTGQHTGPLSLCRNIKLQEGS
jgi:hypothetical protein